MPIVRWCVAAYVFLQTASRIPMHSPTTVAALEAWRRGSAVGISSAAPRSLKGPLGSQPDCNAITHHPVKRSKRPAVESYEGKTPALGDTRCASFGTHLKACRPRARGIVRCWAPCSITLYGATDFAC